MNHQPPCQESTHELPRAQYMLEIHSGWWMVDKTRKGDIYLNTNTNYQIFYIL